MYSIYNGYSNPNVSYPISNNCNNSDNMTTTSGYNVSVINVSNT